MAFNLHPTPHKAPGGSLKKKPTREFIYGRVLEVILSLDNPKCKDSSMLNGVFYRIPSKAADEGSTKGFNFAYQGDPSIRVIPMEGELVQIESKPASGEGGAPEKSSRYWTKIIPIWNHPHHNAAPDTNQAQWKNNLLAGIQEQLNINPLQANPGDVLFEGRLSQSIRFGGFKGIQSKNIDNSNQGKPIILISNGQIETKEGNTPIEEDINKDPNSLYFLSDHKSDLLAVNTKRDSYDVVPIGSDQYIGNQVLINGGRLFFNAKEDSAFISAKESVGLNARTLNLDAKDYMCLDADRIYLGKVARTSSSREPAVLGTQLENWLTSLLDTLESVAIAMTSATSITGGPVPTINAAGPELQAVVNSLKTQIILFQSKKVFTE